MAFEINVLKPDLPRRGDTEQDIHEEWRQERSALQDAQMWPPETNVRHFFRPLWRTEFWSVQCARDKAHWGWVAVYWLFCVAQLAAMIGFFALLYW